MSQHDLDAIADLIRAGERLNIRPHSAEGVGDFARRLGHAENQQPRTRLLPFAGRVVLSAALASIGIALF